MIWFVIVLSIAAFSAVAYCLDTTTRALKLNHRKHVECHHHAEQVGKAVAAIIGRQVLRAAADKWDSVEEQLNIKVMAREKYVPDGPSVPALWLRQLADDMDLSL